MKRERLRCELVPEHCRISRRRLGERHLDAGGEREMIREPYV
jgi:hypothetical protein